MATVLDDIAAHLATQGVGTVGGTTDVAIYKGHMPPDPDQVVALIELRGLAPIDTLGMTAGGQSVEIPMLQVLVRSQTDNYEQARILAETVYKTLHGITGQTVGGGARYLTIEALSSPYNFGEDKNGRWIIGFNLLTWKELN